MKPRPEPTTPDHAPTARDRFVRLGVPPAVSLAVHALLLALIIVIGVGVERGRTPRPRLAEISTPSPAAHAPAQAASLAITPPTLQPAPPPSGTTPTLAQTLPEPSSSFDPRAGSMLPDSPLLSQAPSLTDPDSARTPSVSFAGLQAVAAGKIVYVVDASGAVVPTLTYIKRRLAQSIDRLAPTQRFEIIFFREPADDARDVEPRPSFAGGLTPRNPADPRRAAAWIDTIHGVGRSEPAAAIREAIDLRPDLIFLLSTSIQRTQTDSKAQRSDLLAQLDTLNPADPRTGDRPVVIKSLQFLRPDPANLLRDIALLHGDGEGSYRLLTTTQLDADDPEQETQISAEDPSTLAAAQRLEAIDQHAWTVVLGLPSFETRAQVHAEASQTLDLLDRSAQAHRDTRWGVLHRRASLFFAASHPDGTSLAPLEHAAQLDSPSVLADPGADLERRLVRSVSDTLLGNPEQGQLGRVRDDAAWLDLPWIGLRASLATRLHSSPTQIEINPAHDPRTRLLIAENECRARLATDPTDPDAFIPLLALLDDESLHPAESVRRGLVWGRLLASGQLFEIDWLTAPGQAAMGRAAALTQDSATKPSGLTALDHTANREDLSDEVRAAALWHAAIAERDLAQTDPEAQRRVGGRLHDLVQRFGHTTHARDAAAAGLALGSGEAGQLHDDTPSDFVRLALESFPDHPAADRWRLGLAHRATGLDRLTALEQIPPGSPDEPLACPLYLHAVDQLGSIEALERALSYTHARGRMEWFTLARRLAASLVSTTPARAAQLLLALAHADHPSVEDPPERLTIAAGQALLAADQPAEATAVLTALATRLEGEGVRDEYFWLAWAIVLEALAGSSDADARAQARAHGSRLRLIDPSFGGGSIGARAAEALNRLDSAHEHDAAHGSAPAG